MNAIVIFPKKDECDSKDLKLRKEALKAVNLQNYFHVFRGEPKVFLKIDDVQVWIGWKDLMRAIGDGAIHILNPQALLSHIHEHQDYPRMLEEIQIAIQRGDYHDLIQIEDKAI